MQRILIILLASMLFLSTSCVAVAQPRHSGAVVIIKAPRHHKLVVVKGRKYYTWNGKHYRKTNRGFVFVSI